MATFRVQVFFTHGTLGKWTNVFHVDAADLADAADAAELVLAPDLSLMLATVSLITKVLVSDPATSSYIERVVNIAGTFADAASLLPLWNSVKVLVSTAGFGRPDYKFLKGFVGENTQTDGTLESAFRTQVTTDFNSLIEDMTTQGTPLVSYEGDLWGTAVVQPTVQMRQMHRRRKRAVAP